MVMRVGLIGRGKWGRNIEQTLLAVGDLSVSIIGKHEPLRADLDAVIIASPSATHAELALPYIRAGIATFIEKPMATSVSDAQRIREAAQRSQTPVFVGHIQLYNPAFQALIKKAPALGDVYYVLCDSANCNPRTDSSVLWDWLPHDLSMASAILRADPTCVQAWRLAGTQQVQAAVVRYQYGTTSLVSTMTWLSSLRRRQVTIVAERGVFLFDDRAPQKLILHSKEGNKSYPSYENELPLTRELLAFLQIIRSRSSDASHIALGAAIASAIESAEESIRSGGAAIEIRYSAGNRGGWLRGQGGY